MTDSFAERLLPTTVIRNRKVRAAGRRLDQVIVYDWGFEYEGRQWEQRSFVLLDDGHAVYGPMQAWTRWQGPRDQAPRAVQIGADVRPRAR
ncbi:hypothetical protein [Micromonospora sp. CPCC 206061]|uniref:hypothetical protein n=1 Tax=Micromonospora sp. CPCC 206061 TaxID=3122410 RepID=UPI002FF24804